MAKVVLPAGFEQFAEVAPDAMICVDKQGDIVLVNGQTERLFGHAREDLLGKKIEVLIPKRYTPTHKGHRDSYMADPHVRPMGIDRELWALRKDGTEFPVEISLSPITKDSGIVAASIRDVSERIKAEQKFRGLLDSAPDGMVIVDETGTITLVNAQSQTMFGHTREEMLGNKIEMLIPARFHPKHEGHRDGFFTAPKNRSMGSGLELFALRKDGTEFPVEISLSPIVTEDGRLVAAAIRDVTERKAAEAEAQRASEQAQVLKHFQELDDFRTKFINAAAHELNTPLTPIGATLKVLSISDDPAVRQGSLVILERSFKRMATLISDLLDAARFQSGNLKIKKADVDGKDMLEEAIGAFGAAADEAKITIEANLTDAPMLNCDRSRLVQIAYNLLSNALKFTKEGGKITVTCGSGDVWWFEVSDDGLGMTQEQIGQLFQPFARVHNTSVPGTGLGLYISQGFMEAHGGLISASSKGLGKGATFRVELPLA